ncbi:MAG: GNAT family N-acetyltransferase [Nocardioidaceae bacterium]|nr:GNAT family N-acetyltransferase [Nocardioidaceae bacterium]
MTPFDLRAVGYDHPDASSLIQRVQQEYVERYGSPDESRVEAAEFTSPHGVFVVGYLDGAPVATGAWRVSPIRALGATSAVEVKRMYVLPQARRRGLSRLLLADLELRAVAAGHDLAVLTTGPLQPEAIALYRAEGYLDIPVFGHYADEPYLHAFGKVLAPGSSRR